MTAIWSFVSLLLFVYFIILIGRLILEWVQQFAPQWRPAGFVLVVSEVVYTVTDPPLKALRRVIPPLSIGGIKIDLSFLVLFLIISILMNIRL